MKVKKTFFLLFSIIITFMIVIAVLIVLLLNNQKKLLEHEDIRYKSVSIAAELRHSSDDLTQYCRMYVMTGDTTWETKYWRVLQIRNGLYPRHNGRQIALQDSLQKLGVTKQEFDLLRSSENYSNELVWTEKVAFNAIKGKFADSSKNFSISGQPDIKLAQKIMFDQNYLNAKQKIMTPIANFIKQIQSRTDNTINFHIKKGYILLILSITLIFLIIIISLISYYLIKQKLIEQIRTEQALKESYEELTKAKIKAEESDKNWQNTFNAINDIIVLLSQNHEIIAINKAGLVSLNKSIEEVIGKKCFHLVHNIDFPIANCPCTIARKEKRNFISEYTQDNRTYEISAWPLLDENNNIKAFTHIIKDITQRKKANDELIKEKEKAEESQQRFRKFFEQSLIGFTLTSVDKGWLEVNNAVCEYLGYSKEELFQKTWIELTHPDDLEADLIQFNRLLNKEIEGYKMDKRFFNKNGNIVYTELSVRGKYNSEGKVEYMLALINNISERKQVEEALRRSEADLKRAQQITHIGSFYIDLATNQVTWTEELYKMYGFDPAFPPPLMDESQKLFTPESWKLLSTSISNAAKKGIPYEIELKTIRKDRSNGWMWAKGEAIRNKDSKTIAIWGAVQDITERKTIEQELQIAKEKAEESDTLKTAFLNNISHEVRTPLNSIIGFSQLITKSNITADKLNKFSEIIMQSSNKLIDIITDVIEVSQIHSKQISKINSQFDLIKLINEIVSQFNPQIKNRGLDFVIKISPNLEKFDIISDKNKFHKILKHIIDNSIKFTHQGSIILDILITNEKIDCTVSDTGIGITKEMQEIIFEPFRQVELGITRNYGGNGVGLAIVKGYIQLLNGQITMKSESNIGTTFNISIPFQTVSNTIETKKGTSYILRKIQTILIVEDELSNYEYLAEILRKYCTNILYAEHGQQAIEICKAQKQINIVFMDIKMPIMDGSTATKLIKAFRPDLPIIAITAYALDSDKEKILENDFDDYICKPIQLSELFAVIDKYIIC